MGKRYFSGDFHLGFSKLFEIEKWPFKNIEEHDKFLLDQCIKLNDDDILIHAGDFYSLGFNQGEKTLSIKPKEILKNISATFINIRGNHDLNNDVKSVCESMRIKLGKRYVDVSVSHYPSYDKRASGQFLNGDIHICAHVHSKWRHCLDLDHSVLNINVGCIQWNFNILSEDDLIRYIDSLIKKNPDELIRCKNTNNKIIFLK